MKRLLAIGFIALVTGGWWHGVVVVVGGDVDLNFAAGTNSGCASVAACISTTRNSTSYAEDTTGNLASFAPNVPRITNKGLLVEQSSTNLLLQASAPATTWINTNLTATNNAVSSPDGTTNAGQIVETATNGFHGIDQTVTKPATSLTYTYSAYVKSNDGARNVHFQVFNGANGSNVLFNLTGGGSVVSNGSVGSGYTQISFGITPSVGGFYRIQMSFSTTTATSMTAQMYLVAGTTYSYAGNTTSALQVFCAQIELGLIPTSCMNSTTTQAARPADVMVPAGILTTNLSSAQGYVAAALAANVSSNGYVLSRSLTTDAFVRLQDIVHVASRQGSADLTVARIGKLPVFTAGSFTAASSWGSNSISTVTNGGTVIAASGTYAGSFNSFIGSSDGTNNFLNGYIERLRVGNTKPSDVALLALAPGSGAANCGTYFVSLAGNDSNDGCSTAAPWLTITKLNSAFYLPGDTISLRRGDAFTGCIDLGSSNWFATQATPATIGAYSAGAAPILNANCTGETGTVRFSGMDGVVLQDLDLRAPTIPTPRANIMIENTTGSMHGGYTIQRNLIGGARYFESTRPGGAGTQGTDGGNIEVKGYPNPGGMQNISVLNNTICGLSGVASADDVGRSGFGGGAGVFNETWRGNIVCNIGGGPSDVTANGVNYPPMGDGIEFNSVFGVLAEFNITHDLGNNFINCGGPAGLLTFSVTDVIWQFNESYNVQPKAGNYAQTGQCDFLGYDFDNFTLNSLAQYNYSHDNWGTGFYHFNAGGGSWDNNTHRYSVSENDSKGGAPSFGALGIFNQGGNPALYFYNMTTYNDVTYSGAPFGNYNQQATGFSVSTNATFSGVIANNVIATSTNIYSLCSFISAGGAGFSPTVVLRNNRYYCLSGTIDYRWAGTGYSSLAAYQTGASQDANSSSGTANWGSTRPTGTCSWTPSLSNGPQSCPGGYHLSAGSSGLLGTGVNLNSVYGLSVGTRDYYGNALSNGIGSGFNIGADGQAH